MYYKLKIEDEVVDAVANPMWLRSQRRGGPVVTFDKEEAEGVVASDGSESFNLFGHVLDETWRTVEAVEITLEEYERLKEGEEEEEEPAGETTPPADDVMSRAELTRKAKELAQKVEELEAENRELREEIDLILSGVTE